MKCTEIPVTYTYSDFIQEVKNAMNKKSISYNFDLKDRQWSSITSKFIDLLENL